MTLLVRLALRNAVRSPTRTGLTALTLVLGTALLTVAMAWLDGVFGDSLAKAAEPVGHVRVADPDWARREALFPLASNLPETDGLVERIAAVPGVVAVYPRIVQPVTLTVDRPDGEALGEVLGLAIGASDAWMRERLALEAALTTGRLAEGDGEVVLGATLARRLGARPGDDLLVLGSTQDGSLAPIRARLVGVASQGSAVVDQGVFLTLEKSRWMADIPDGATELLVYGASRDDAPALARAVGALGLESVVVEAWSARAPWSALLGLLAFVRAALEGIIVLVTALGVWNTMMMSVLERQSELGVLRAMGLSRAGTVALCLIEALGIAVIGGAVGVGLGAVGALWLETNGLDLGPRVAQNLAIQVPTRVHADFQPSIAAWAFGLGLLTAALGSLAPAMRAAAIQPVDAIRS